jgi:hypothetical protein
MRLWDRHLRTCLPAPTLLSSQLIAGRGVDCVKKLITRLSHADQKSSRHVLRPCPEEPGGGDPATRANCAPGPSTGTAGNFPGHPRPRFYSAPPFPVLCVRACGQRDHPLYLPVRAVDPRTVRTRAASVHEAIVSRIGVLFCMASRRVSAGVIDRGPAPCSRKHVCSCREKTRRPCRIPLAYVAHFFLRTLLCGELTRWRPPGVLRLDLEATHRDRLFSATLAGTQTARATTLRTREKIKGNTEPL